MVIFERFYTILYDYRKLTIFVRKTPILTMKAIEMDFWTVKRTSILRVSDNNRNILNEFLLFLHFIL